MTNLTIVDFYTPIIIPISVGLMHLALILQVFMLPFILYAILKKSNMGLYRWYFINTITSNTSFIILLSLMSPIPLGGYAMLLIDSPIENWLSIGSWYTILYISLASIVCTDGGVIACICYRIAHLLNLPQIMKRGDVIDQPWFLKSVIFIVAFVGIGVFGLTFEARRASVLDQKNYDGILQEYPFLENLFRERKIMILSGSNTDVTPLIILLFLIISFLIFGAIFLTIFPLMVIKYTKKNRSPKTYQLQLKLYRACVIQIWVIVFLLAIPGCIEMFIYSFHPSSSAILAQTMVTIASFHGPVDLFVIGYFIPSHRKFFAQLFKKFLNQLKNPRQFLYNDKSTHQPFVVKAVMPQVNLPRTKVTPVT